MLIAYECEFNSKISSFVQTKLKELEEKNCMKKLCISFIYLNLGFADAEIDQLKQYYFLNSNLIDR